jgi:D-2-hydroxyacid dehydrogenase (NADP+)
MRSPPIVVDPGSDIVGRDDLLDRRPDLTVDRRDDVVAALAGAAHPVALLTTPTAWDDAYLDALASGDWVTTLGSGYETYPLDELREQGVALTNTPGVGAPQVAEHAFATAFSFSRRLWTFREQQRNREWNKLYPDISDLYGEACCVVGLGRIGEAVAERAAAFGMDVRGVKRTVEGYDGVADAVYRPDALQDALDGTRLVVLAVPLTDATRRMVGPDELARTADDAILVNVARGAVLDTDALLAALDDRTLGAACLDVTDPEPLPRDSPLWDREDVLVTPHSAGHSDKYTERFLDRFFPQYDRWRRGEELHHRVV